LSVSSEKEGNPYRYELKLPLQRYQFLEIEHWLRHAGIMRRKVFPDRLVHSVYLDSATLDDYQDNVAGLSRRGKIRLRWYNDACDSLVLELKNKRGRVANKLVMELENSAGTVPLQRTRINQLLGTNPRSLSLARQLNLFPSLHVMYQRAYYEIAPEIRMTVDTGIRYQKLYPVRSHKTTPSSVDVVVEIKYPMHRKQAASELLQGLPARVFRHSKYIIGVDTVCDL
jgi:hypothetical protein